MAAKEPLQTFDRNSMHSSFIRTKLSQMTSYLPEPTAEEVLQDQVDQAPTHQLHPATWYQAWTTALFGIPSLPQLLLNALDATGYLEADMEIAK